MNFWLHIVVRSTMALLILTFGVFALDIEYLGSIDNDLQAPVSVLVESDRVVVLEPHSKDIKLFSPDGALSHKVNMIGNPLGLARLTADRYLVCDRDRGAVVSIDMSDHSQTDFAGPESGLVTPIDIVAHAGDTYVLDAGSNLIHVLSGDGSITATIEFALPDGEEIGYASSFDYDPTLGMFYVLDQTYSRILAVDRSGTVTAVFGSFGAGQDEITRGGDVAVAPDGRVFVTDRFQGEFIVFDADGKYLGRAGSGAESPRTLALPIGIDVDEQGNVYVASNMGGGISMYHVSVTKPIVVVEASAAFPEDGAEVELPGLKLIAYAEAESALDIVTGFDFRLFAYDDPTKPIDEATAITPYVMAESGLGLSTVAGEWTPQAELTDGQQYVWTVRTQTPDTLSDWSPMKTFRILSIPGDYQLHQNYPNPFNPSTNIAFTLPVDCRSKIEVFSLLGRLVTVVEDKWYEAGNHVVVWDGTDQSGDRVASGVYFYRLSTDGYSESKKMVMLK